MLFLRQTFTIILLSLLGIFVVSPSIALGSGGDSVVIMSTRMMDACTVNVQCQDDSDIHILCRSIADIIVPLSCSIQNLSGNTHPLGDDLVRQMQLQDRQYQLPIHPLILYKGPDTYIYPFVSIIKIQV